MKPQIWDCCRLAFRDWKFESLLSLCSVLALASMLAPILILLGLQNGVIEGMRKRLLEDPSVLIITPKSDGGQFSKEEVASLMNLPGARYAIPRTRAIALDFTLRNPDTGKRQAVAFEPATEGEPVLSHAGLPVPASGEIPEIILSATAARSLDVQPEGSLIAVLNRKTPQGRLESSDLALLVKAVLPEEAASGNMAFVGLPLLEDLENYRDYLEVRSRGFEGDENTAPKMYSSFRLYAKNLDSVESLASELGKMGIETTAATREIAAIKNLERAINKVILIISLTVGTGFAAFAVSSALGAVNRKRRMLGMLRLLGLRRLPLVFYPIVQTLLTAIAGLCLALLVYLGVSEIVIGVFFPGEAFECILTWQNLAWIVAAILVLSVFSCIRAAWKAASVEPSIVIRDV